MRFIDASLTIRQIIVISFILALVLSIIELFTAIRLCKRKGLVITSSLTFTLSFLSVFLTMRGSYRYRVNKEVFEPSLTILKLPLWIFIAIAIILFVALILSLLYAISWNKKNLSPTSIKESADTLPSGICFYDKNGLVRLINEKMNQLCILTTNKALLNGVEFFNKIANGDVVNCISLKKGDEPIIEYNDKTVFSFKRYEHNIDGKIVYEIVALDITKLYFLTIELEKKLNELKAIKKRLIEYGDKVDELAYEKELLKAKIRVHDDMGKLMLTSKRKLSENLSNEDKKRLLSFWKEEIETFKNIKETEKKSNLKVIDEAAKLIGINIDFKGIKPKPSSINEKILVTAMHECLTNTMSHANGKNMYVISKQEDDKYIIIISNDGKKPQGRIVEGGGLSSLRLLVERENGKMTINSQNGFELIISLRMEMKHNEG